MAREISYPIGERKAAQVSSYSSDEEIEWLILSEGLAGLEAAIIVHGKDRVIRAIRCRSSLSELNTCESLEAIRYLWP